MKWISTRDSLPDEDSAVLVAVMCESEDHDGVTQRWPEVHEATLYRGAGQLVACVGETDEYLDDEILGWMPLPDPPVEYPSPIGVVHERVDAIATFDSVAQGPSSPQVTPPKYDPSWHGSQAHTFVTDKPVGSEVKPRTQPRRSNKRCPTCGDVAIVRYENIGACADPWHSSEPEPRTGDKS